MNFIDINMADIEKKFSQLKAYQLQSSKYISIAEVIEFITFNKVLAIDVNDYLANVENPKQKVYAQYIQKNWRSVDIDEIKQLLDKVVTHKKKNFQQHKNKVKDTQKYQAYQKKKTKSKNDAHQNPYIPPKIQALQKPKITQKVTNINQQENLITTLQQKQIKENYSQQKKQEIQEFYQNSQKQPLQNDSQDQNFHLEITNNPNKKYYLSLPQNFKSLPVQERYSILSKKHGTNKKILQKRFDMIYKHYRKQMYIPYESFQINNELLMDLRIFLKYFKDFDMSKKFKTNQALKHFKKIAINGLWLDDKNFVSLHYKLIDLLDTNLLLQNFDSNDPKKVNQMKKETLKNIKSLKENLRKLKELSQLVSEDRIKQVFRTAKTQTVVNKIIESHSGLSQQDVILKLKERNQLRKSKKAQINNNQKVITWSPDKSKFLKTNDATSQRSELLHQISIYKQIQLPKFRSREMRNSSVYSSLEILNMQKEKQRLRELVRQKDNERYLQQFFKKQKNTPVLARSNSLGVIRSSIKDETQNFSVNSLQIRKNRLPQINLLRKNFSLPRMRFT